MWTPEEQRLLATLSRGQRELMIQARVLQQAQDPLAQQPAQTAESDNAEHQTFLQRVDQLVFDSDMPLPEKQKLLYGLHCRCCGMFGGASIISAAPPQRG